jgi:hypothetical protein
VFITANGLAEEIGSSVTDKMRLFVDSPNMLAIVEIKVAFNAVIATGSDAELGVNKILTVTEMATAAAVDDDVKTHTPIFII